MTYDAYCTKETTVELTEQQRDWIIQKLAAAGYLSGDNYDGSSVALALATNATQRAVFSSHVRKMEGY